MLFMPHKLLCAYLCLNHRGLNCVMGVEVCPATHMCNAVSLLTHVMMK